MGFFNRRTAPADANTATATGTHERKPGIFSRRGEKTAHHHGHHGSNAWNSRPTFGQWIKATALDIVSMAILGAIGLGVYMADPAPSRSFPITFQDGEIVYPEFAYPLRNEIVPIWAAALIAFFVPFAVFLIVQIRARSFWDINNATIGLLYSLITAAVFQVFIKWLIGGLRPHFLAVCKPDLSRANVNTGGNVANGYRQIMFDRSVCTGDKSEINDALESMPSGHTTAAFAGFVFLYLYLNAKLKVFSNYHPAMWKLAALYAPLLGACLIAGALTIDEYHNWYDLAAGATIGSIMAFSSYRMVYASVWDFRFNHIPLLRTTPFVYGAGPSTLDGFHDALFTRKAGWGTHDGSAWGGAPGDASDGPRGTMAQAANAVTGAATHGAANGRGTHGGVVGVGGEHSVNRKPVGDHHVGHTHGHSHGHTHPDQMV
ncbi:acid phosphatase/Vanadium-dependent haloperoxidase [Aaosphaeria arxii CBS 175.79]|uniref:Acid phosphatase/Vanadium-dependent haloperoxidase n=1 Tax=Aaosphaeria arxii CBS 175.79 TaxID=1450172 RepID=A0A6A5Y4E4_9PLEO|nr:acid phosphatase/Vanadium-dependent haloperoxidase [Aaosphaeria arxii CBS 175.79]KAF2019670.1 acid phosphatase/Vanadium-dependent haloperoxidase [Aaosphaeria arxii CBS 175.79]